MYNKGTKYQLQQKKSRNTAYFCLAYFVASHAGVSRGARTLPLPINACSTENDIPFPNLANHIVPTKFWKVDLDRRVTR